MRHELLRKFFEFDIWDGWILGKKSIWKFVEKSGWYFEKKDLPEKIDLGKKPIW